MSGRNNRALIRLAIQIAKDESVMAMYKKEPMLKKRKYGTRSTIWTGAHAIYHDLKKIYKIGMKSGFNPLQSYVRQMIFFFRSSNPETMRSVVLVDPEHYGVWFKEALALTGLRSQ